MAFLLNSVLLPDGSSDQVLSTTTYDLARDAIAKYDIVKVLVSVLVDSGEVDEDLEEKAARALLSFLDIGGRLEREDSVKLSTKLEKLKGTAYWGLAKEERDSLQRFVSAFS